jgi:hypothetical protein
MLPSFLLWIGPASTRLAVTKAGTSLRLRLDLRLDTVASRRMCSPHPLGVISCLDTSVGGQQAGQGFGKVHPLRTMVTGVVSIKLSPT